MAVLRVKDENGNIIDIPAIKGEDGKSAYQSAVSGGFSGTEEEFNAVIANMVSSAERPTAQKVITSEDANYMFSSEMVGSGKYFFLALVERDDAISEGTEIADIEISCDGIADGEYVSIREMFVVDEKPYMILSDKAYFHEQRGVVAVVIYFPVGLNSITTKVDNYEWTSARITYYTD